jgi:glucosamine kinase
MVLTLGVDAGGSGSRAVLASDGRVVQRYELGPLNVLLHADALNRLATLIGSSRAERVGLGLAGVRTQDDAERIAAALHARTGVMPTVRDDSEAALAGAFRGGPGVVVIAGTGSGAVGRNAAGVGARVGGHGFLLGDEGGGYWIGRQAVSAALRAADGTGPPTRLTDLVHDAFGDLADAVHEVHTNPADRGLLARLVPAVAACAEGGDAEAGRILADAADHLARLVTAVEARLGAGPVAMVGGIFGVGPVRERFVAATAAVDPAEPPEMGALLLVGTPPIGYPS